ncbi:MAG: type I phosphomannose isomerase catalytic subunit [Chloroflexota bacterium]
MSELAPFRVAPQIDLKPRGGTRLATFGFNAPEGAVEPLGEVHITHGSSGAASGAFAGSTLAELAAAQPERFVGRLGLRATGGAPIFPLLIKFIDASQDLSVQLHPDDLLAREQGELTGKTEAWHVLAATEGAELYAGLEPGFDVEDFAEGVRAGEPGMVRFLRRIPAVPGQTVLLPAGTIHALGAGVMIYEIQQPSNTTYRLWDWNRLDGYGKPRELHLDLGMRAMRPEISPEPTWGLPMPSMDAQRDLLTACSVFALERLTVHVGDLVAMGMMESPQVITCLGGVARVAGHGSEVLLQRGESAIVPVGAICALEATMPAVVLRGWVPDLLEDVIRPARAEGASDEEIAALAAPLEDLRQAIRRT